ncbi:type VI secretion system accessory protein TagJ, partial [Salmonella enterica subsp. enterica serovar Virginia]|nr:type VI secretion system accessory protein TagJ [Salmonella enterica subsp. enterica serovar Virginia]
SRLGPVLELVTGGVYIWLPFSQIRSLESPQPTRLTDLLWKPIDRNKKYLSVIPAEDVIAATEKMLPHEARTIDLDSLL